MDKLRGKTLQIPWKITSTPSYTTKEKLKRKATKLSSSPRQKPASQWNQLLVIDPNDSSRFSVLTYLTMPTSDQAPFPIYEQVLTPSVKIHYNDSSSPRLISYLRQLL